MGEFKKFDIVCKKCGSKNCVIHLDYAYEEFGAQCKDCNSGEGDIFD
jgi:hypothetical protein